MTPDTRLSDGWKTLAVEQLCKYLKIKTVQPNPDYDAALGSDLGFDQCWSINVTPSRPIVIFTIKGTESTLPSILLNSHMDVVPVSQEKWTKSPFEAVIEDGKIYGRGSQDMKSVGMTMVIAAAMLIENGSRPKRTIHLTFVPDEEIGGKEGMALFVQTPTFKDLNVGFALDEGIPSPYEQLMLFNGERVPWWICVRATGNAGHGSAMLQGTAIERLYRFLELVFAFRAEQMKKLEQLLMDGYWRVGKVTSINVTMLEAGKQVNVHPDMATVCLDVRITKDIGEKGIIELLNKWTSSIPGTSYEIIQKNPLLDDLPLDNQNPFLEKITSCLASNKIPGKMGIFPGATDSRYLRELGIPAIGLSPFRHTPILLHDHDEYLGVKEYLEGIEIYYHLLCSLSSSF